MRVRFMGRMGLTIGLVLLIISSVGAVAVASAATAPRVVVDMSGTVTGKGGSGARAWSMPVSGAFVVIQGASVAAISGTNGTYAFAPDLPTAAPYAPYYADLAVNCTHKWFVTATKALTDANPQVCNFSLTVKGTTLKVLATYNGRRIRGAKVSCFGKSAYTTATGVATLKGLTFKPATLCSASITKPGYRLARVKFTSSPGGTRSKTARLVRR